MWEIMTQLWLEAQQFGKDHNVNATLFAFLYFGSIPPYIVSIGWLIRTRKHNRPIFLPLISTFTFFILPAAYIGIYGENIAWWVYAAIGVLIGYGAYTLYLKITCTKKNSGTTASAHT